MDTLKRPTQDELAALPAMLTVLEAARCVGMGKSARNRWSTPARGADTP